MPLEKESWPEEELAVITGGSTGIGLAMAKLFVREGAHVFIAGRRQKELDEAVNEIGSTVTGPIQLPRERCFSPRMTRVLSRASNCSLMVAERDLTERAETFFAKSFRRPERRH